MIQRNRLTHTNTCQNTRKSRNHLCGGPHYTRRVLRTTFLVCWNTDKQKIPVFLITAG